MAFLVAPETVSPFIPGSDEVIFRSTITGGFTSIGSLFYKTISQTSWPINHFFASPI